MKDKTYITVQVDQDLRQYIKGKADQEKRSMGNWVRWLIEQYRQTNQAAGAGLAGQDGTE